MVYPLQIVDPHSEFQENMHGTVYQMYIGVLSTNTASHHKSPEKQEHKTRAQNCLTAHVTPYAKYFAFYLLCMASTKNSHGYFSNESDWKFWIWGSQLVAMWGSCSLVILFVGF